MKIHTDLKELLFDFLLELKITEHDKPNKKYGEIINKYKQ